MELFDSWNCFWKHFANCLLKNLIFEQMRYALVGILILQNFRGVSNSTQQTISKKFRLLFMRIVMLMSNFFIIKFRSINKRQQLIGWSVRYFLSQLLSKSLYCMGHSILSEIVFKQGKLIDKHNLNY